MIFSKRNVAAIRKGEKTQTRRRSDRYKAGRSYAVQRHRGDQEQFRIAVTATRRERLMDITEEDARAEGFKTQGAASAREQFLAYWHDHIAGSAFDHGEVVNVIEFEVVDG